MRTVAAATPNARTISAKCGNGGAAAGWFSGMRECAPGPQGRPNRPSSTILLVGGRRWWPIDGLSIGQTDSYIA